MRFFALGFYISPGDCRPGALCGTEGNRYDRRLYNCPFYRATLCVSAVLAVARCLSVCLSVCHVGGLYPVSAEDIVKLLCRPGSPIILVF